MGNHSVGKAIGLLAVEAERGRNPEEPALAVLDRICFPFADCDAEFEAEDPDRRGCSDPVCADYRDPHPDRPVAALGRLMVEAFAPAGSVDLARYAQAMQVDPDAAYDTYASEVIEPFSARYKFW